MATVDETTGSARLNSDTPLTHRVDDLLDRSAFASHLANVIREMRADQSFVFAINGPWGSGKSTVKNFILESLHERQGQVPDLTVVQFNPWWFSDREMFVRRFFGELAAAIHPHDGDGDAKTVRLLRRLGRVLQPFTHVPGAMGDVADVLKKGTDVITDVISDTEPPATVESLRAELDQTLIDSNVRFLVIIDDIDRLPAEEIREIFRLVTVVGNFPRTMYMMLFDRAVVVKALAEVQVDRGEVFLDKVVQLSFDLPAIGPGDLSELFFQNLDREMMDHAPSQLSDQQAFREVYWKGARGFLRTPRDVARLLNGFHALYPTVRDEVYAADYFGIEILRTFANPVYQALARNRPLVTGDYSDTDLGLWLYVDGEKRNERIRGEFEPSLSTLEPDRDAAAQRILSLLMPSWDAAKGRSSSTYKGRQDQASAHRRLASDAFDVYFRFGLMKHEYGFAAVHDLLELGSEPERLKSVLVDLAIDAQIDGRPALREPLSAIQGFIGQTMSDQHRINLLRVLLAIGDELMVVCEDRDWSGARGDSTIDRMLIRITYGLIAGIPDSSTRFEVLSSEVQSAKSLSILASVVHLAGLGHGRYGRDERIPSQDQLLVEEHVDNLEKIFVERLRTNATTGSLGDSANLVFILHFWSLLDEAGAGEFRMSLLQSPAMFLNYAASCASLIAPDETLGRPNPIWRLDKEPIVELARDKLVATIDACEALVNSIDGNISTRQINALRLLTEIFKA